MTQTITRQPVGLTREAVEALAEQRREPDWLRSLRLDAFAAYDAAPLPTMQTEGWRRTSLRGLDLEHQAAFADSAAELEAELPTDLANRGVVVHSLAEAIADPVLGARVREHLGQIVRPGEDKFTALHYAFLNAGAVVFVPRNVVVAEPLELSHSFAQPGLAAFAHTLVIADESAEVSIVDEYRSRERGSAPLASGVVELAVGQNAKVRYVQVQDWASDAWSFSWQKAVLQRDAHLRILDVVLGGRTTRNTVQAILEGNGSQADLLGVVALAGREHVDFQTLQDHYGSDTRSDLVLHNALRGQASSNFTGLIRIEKVSRRTESSQEQKNILLSSKAKADSDPRLEILNNDVIRCTHGAAVGPVDENLVFYLQSRGLSRDEAEHLIVEGFFRSVLETLRAPDLEASVWKRIQRKLASQEQQQA